MFSKILFQQSYTKPSYSFRLKIESFGKKLTQAEKINKIEVLFLKHQQYFYMQLNELSQGFLFVYVDVVRAWSEI